MPRRSRFDPNQAGTAGRGAGNAASGAGNLAAGALSGGSGGTDARAQRLARQRAQRRLSQQIRTGTYERSDVGRAYLRAREQIRLVSDGPPFRTTGGVEWYMNVYGQVIEYPPSHVTDNLRGTVDLAELTEWWITRFVGMATETHADDFQGDADMLIADMYQNWSDDQRIAVMRMGFANFQSDLSRRTKEYLALDEATRRTAPQPWGWYHSSRR